jgi:penicillin-binding protein 1B
MGRHVSREPATGRAGVTRLALALALGAAGALAALALAVAWGLWAYRLPDPRADIEATVHLYASGRPLATVQGDGRRAQVWVPLDRIPRVVVDAVLVAEDRRFFEHPGVDLIGIARAAVANLWERDAVQGGSTLTQQLARTLFLASERSWSRKVREARIALQLEMQYDKPRILEAYLNSVYLGHDHQTAVHGVAAAAQRFLGRDLAALRPDEAALLAVAIRAPNRLLVPGDRARRLRDLLLRDMVAQGALSAAAGRAAMARPLPARAASRGGRHGYFVDVAREEIERRVALPPGGEVRIGTALDLGLQAAAESAVRAGLERLERQRRLAPGALQAAVVAIEPATGRVRALVGGRRYADSQFNRAVRAQRQPGSLFKPFVYLAAFERLPEDAALTPASVIQDEPVSIRAAEGPWSPRNMDGRYRGPVTVRRALEESLNVPAARVAQSVGVRSVARVASGLGVESRLAAVPSLALGSSEVTLLEITSAFAAIANGGVRVAPTALDPEAGPAPVPAIAPPPSRVRAVSPAAAFLITHLLRGVMQTGTGSASARYGLSGITAGKTGTTDDLRDAWFVGYTPDLAVGVWVGMDDGRPIGLTGSEGALPIWAAVMQAAVRRAPPRPFTAPPGVVMADVERETGRRVSAWCAHGPAVTEAFLAGTEPRADCAMPPAVAAGAGTVLDWFRGLFR